MNKQRLLLFGVLISVVTLVVLNIGMAGNGHVEVVNENITLEEKNTTLVNKESFKMSTNSLYDASVNS